MSSRKIAAALRINKETVLKYLKYDATPKDIIVYKNNYEAYLDIIADQIVHGKNITEIFKRIVKEGFKGKLTAFSSWFGKNYPDYKSKNKQKESRKEMIEKKNPAVLFDTLSPRKISIYLSNSTLGVNKAGVTNKEHSLIQKIIQCSPLLQDLKKIVQSFRELLKSEMPELLDKWMEDVLLYKMPNINSFIKGIKTDIDAVRNAIIYQWSNGFVEGSVNRLKTKKREMYGRAGFQLLRRKVVLSKMG